MNVDGARSLTYVDVWGTSRYRNVGCVVCSINHEERSVANHARCPMSHGYFERSGDWPGSGLGSGPDLWAMGRL